MKKPKAISRIEYNTLAKSVSLNLGFTSMDSFLMGQFHMPSPLVEVTSNVYFPAGILARLSEVFLTTFQSSSSPSTLYLYRIGALRLKSKVEKLMMRLRSSFSNTKDGLMLKSCNLSFPSTKIWLMTTAGEKELFLSLSREKVKSPCVVPTSICLPMQIGCTSEKIKLSPKSRMEKLVIVWLRLYLEIAISLIVQRLSWLSKARVKLASEAKPLSVFTCLKVRSLLRSCLLVMMLTPPPKFAK